MGERLESPPGPPTSQHDRLDSWKQVAVYLGRGVTTVQRWEQEEGLPVHRLPHAKKGSVFAFRSELDAWLASRSRTAPPAPPGAVRDAGAAPVRAASASRARLLLGILAALTLVAGIVASRWWTVDGGSSATVAPVLPRPLANGVELETSPSLSPDGREVVYTIRQATTELYVKPVAGGPARRLEIAGELRGRNKARPTWSPRGDLIAFLHEETDSRRGLYVVPRGGGTPRRVTTISGIGVCWSPDGEHLGFTDRESVGEPFSIYSIPVTGGARTRLTLPPRASFGDTHCAWSPDGRALAVGRFVSRHESNLHVVRLDSGSGEHSTRLTEGLSGIEGIAWTPDGTSIVVGTTHGLWKVAAAGGGGAAIPVAGLEGGALAPSLSRPARGEPVRLAYQYRVFDVNVWRWTPAGDPRGTIARVTDSMWWDDFPALSPDGRRVAFASNRTAATELWVADIDGSNARQITQGFGSLVLSPQWSPDGRQVAFSAHVGGNRDIYVAAADGSWPERLTVEPSEDGNPAWSRDGKWIYFRSDRSGVGQLWKAPRAGGAPVRVTARQASQGFESPDGRLLYFVSGGDVSGLWAVPVDGGAEENVLPNVLEGLWAVTDREIVYIPSRTGAEDKSVEVRTYDLSSRTTSTFAVLRPALLPLMPGFSVSRDGRTMLWTQIDTAQHDVMLIDPWR